MKSVLILSLALLSGGLMAQGSIQLSNANDATVIIAPNSVIQLTTAALDNTKFSIDIKNTSGSTKQYKAKRYDVVLNSGADAYFCFAGTCYGPPTIISPDALTLTPNQSASQVPGSFQILVADLDEPATIGYSHIKYTFFDINNPSDSVQVSLKYNIALGLSDLNKSVQALSLYPNPCEGTSNLILNANSAFQAKLRVFNALGDVVMEQALSISQGSNRVELPLGNLSPGVYLVNLRSGQSGLTKRLVVK